MKKKYIISFIILLFLSGFYWYSNSLKNTSPKNYSIVLTKDGFSPKKITINLGDTVIFTSENGEDFWPASDLHPTHGMYPDFDPKEPVKAQSSWSYKFDKVGNWKFHDHLNSLYVGEIVVRGNTSSNKDRCSDSGGQIQCWQELLDKTLEEKGLPETFDLLADLYSREPLFASECHSFAHEIGKRTYEKFRAKEDFDLNSKTSYCGYGFYHGFMETLLQTTGDVKQAKDFCKYVGTKLTGETTDGEGACYHGIGHGAVDGGDPNSWGNAEKMLAPGLKICLLVAGDDRSQYGKLYRCVTGSYNALEILSVDPKYKLDKINSDPFYICKNQLDEYKQGCYTNMLPAVLRLTRDDLLKAEKYIENIPNKNIAFKGPIVSDLFHEFIRLNLNKPDYNKLEGIKMCHSLSLEYSKYCVDGLSGGHMKYGNPGSAHIKGLAFCVTSELRDSERDVCYNSILSRLLIWYSSSKSKEICQSIPTQFQKYCRIQN